MCIAAAIDIYFPSFNYVSREYIDPAIGLVLSLGGGAQNMYVLLQLLLFGLGSAFLIRVLSLSFVKQLAGFGIAAAALASVCKADPFLIKVEWLPWLIASLLLLFKRATPFRLLCTVGASLFWIFSAGSIAFIGAGAAVLFALRAADPRDASAFSRALSAGVVLLLLSGSLIAMPVYQMPAYPSEAKLIEISPVTFSPTPLIGPSYQPNPLDFWAMLAALRLHILLLLLFLAVTAVPAVWSGERFNKILAPYLISGSWAAVLILQFKLDETFCRNFLPLELARVILPGAAINELPWTFTPIVLSLFVPALVAAVQPRVAVMQVIAAFLLAACLSLGSGPGPDFLRAEADHFSARPPSHTGRLLYSPSGRLIRSIGEAAPFEQDLTEQSASAIEGLKVRADLKSEAAAFAIDGSLDTRWGTGRPQQGGEAFEIEFPQPIKLSGIRLALSKNRNDFPRAIKIETAADSKSLKVFEESPWLGPVRWSPDGYPYFGDQPDVTIRFRRPVEARELKIVQTGRDRVFDWSINEIFFLFSPDDVRKDG